MPDSLPLLKFDINMSSNFFSIGHHLCLLSVVVVKGTLTNTIIPVSVQPILNKDLYDNTLKYLKVIKTCLPSSDTAEGGVYSEVGLVVAGKS